MSSTPTPRPRGYHLDSLRAVALGFKPRERRPAWAAKAFLRGASSEAWAIYEAHPLTWPEILRTARRGRLLARCGGAGDCIPPEMADYGRNAPDTRRERERLLILLEEATACLRGRLRASKPGLSRAYGDFHWAMDWLSR